MKDAWRKVVTVTGPVAGRGSVLGPDTARRGRWWELGLECGHTATPKVRYAPLPKGMSQRGGTQHRLASDVLAAPRKVICHGCRAAQRR
jgi:hypothetical protein